MTLEKYTSSRKWSFEPLQNVINGYQLDFLLLRFPVVEVQLLSLSTQHLEGRFYNQNITGALGAHTCPSLHNLVQFISMTNTEHKQDSTEDPESSGKDNLTIL